MFTYASFLSTISIVILQASPCAIVGNNNFNDGNKRTEINMAWYEYGNNKHIGEEGNNTHYNDNKNIHKDGINKYNSNNKNVDGSSIQVVDKNKTKKYNNKHLYGKRKRKNGARKREHSNKILGERNNNEDDNKKLDNGNKEHEDGTSHYGNKNGNYRRFDGSFAPAPPPDKDNLNPTESWAEIVKQLTTPTSRNNKFNQTQETTVVRRRTTPYRVSLEEDCDYLAYYCMKAYKTGKICARTLYYNYRTFDNYCMLDYVNCMERYEVWQITHMGECFTISILQDYQHYEYQDDSFLDQVYVIQE